MLFYNLGHFTNFGVGLLNGIHNKQNGLPYNVKYTTLGVTSLMYAAKIIIETPKAELRLLNPISKLFAISFVTGSIFCLGTQLGKSFHIVNDNDDIKKND